MSVAFFACVYVCASLKCLVSREVRRGLDPLELELQVLLSIHAGVGNRT